MKKLAKSILCLLLVMAFCLQVPVQVLAASGGAEVEEGDITIDIEDMPQVTEPSETTEPSESTEPSETTEPSESTEDTESTEPSVPEEVVTVGIGDNTVTVKENYTGMGNTYTFTAPATGTLTVSATSCYDATGAEMSQMSMMMSGVEVYVSNGTGSISLFSSETELAVTEGDEITVQVTAGRGVDFTINFNLALEEATVVTYEPGYYDNTMGDATVKVTVPAGGTNYLNCFGAEGYTANIVVAGGVAFSHGEEGFTFNASQEGMEYPLTLTTDLTGRGLYQIAFTNYNTEDVEMTVNITAQAAEVEVGTVENPAELVVPGTNTIDVTEDSAGYNYTWTATANGELTIVVSSTSSWEYSLNNVTQGVYGDLYATSYNDPDTQTITVAEGDKITLYVNTELTYDENYNRIPAPAGTLTVVTSFEEASAPVTYEPGYYDNTMGDATVKVTVPAGGTNYLNCYGAEGYTANIIAMGGVAFSHGEEGFTFNASLEGVEYPLTLTTDLTGRGMYQIAFTNYNTEDVEMTVNITAQAAEVEVGTVENPAELVVPGTNEATVAEDSQGYNYTWTATADGELTIVVSSTSSWEYSLNNVTQGVYGDLYATSYNDPDTQTITVAEGDKITLYVNTELTYDENYNRIPAPAGTLTVVTSFVEASEPDYIVGDMNSDGEVNDADAIHLLRHTLFADVYTINQSGDMNSDGEVNDADAIHLLRYTLFPDVYPLPEKQ